MIKVTYYLEVTSSWCYWAEPAWSELKARYAGKAAFGWKIAQMPAEAYPVSQNQCEWFYRRSGSMVRSSFMLNSDWLEPEIKVYLVPNLVAEAAKDFGATDDRVRLAIAHAALSFPPCLRQTSLRQTSLMRTSARRGAAARSGSADRSAP